jgi:hypothetical protein
MEIVRVAVSFIFGAITFGLDEAKSHFVKFITNY